MATRSIFDHTQNNTTEKDLIESLVIESIQIYGVDTYYMPQNTTKLDNLFGEDAGTTVFDTAYPVEMYIKNVDGFEGEGDFMQQFGLEIRDQVTFTVAKKRYEELSTNTQSPQPGSLLWFPITGQLFRIQYVEHESIFYQLGEIYVYDLQCELFEFADERFETGILEIDEYGRSLARGYEYELEASGSGTFIDGETVYQGTDLQSATFEGSVKSYDLTSTPPTIELIGTNSQPASGVALTGVDSGAEWTIVLDTADAEEDMMTQTGGDNWDIEQEAMDFLDFSEDNPFGDI